MATDLAIIRGAMLPESSMQVRIESQIVIEAGIIIKESPSVDNHVNRLTWANKVLGINNASFIPTTARQLLLLSFRNATAQQKGNNLSDPEIEFIIRGELLSDQVIIAQLNG